MASDSAKSAPLGAAAEQLLDFVESFSAVGQVPRIKLDSFEDVMFFMREHVGRNRPAIISGLMKDSAAMNWTPEQLASQYGEQEVDVNLTPNGLADAIVPTWCDGSGKHTLQAPADAPEAPPLPCFLEPHVAKQPLGEALRRIVQQAHTPKGSLQGDVSYISAQNDSLRCQFPFLAGDVPPSLPWAQGVFGCAPDAVNLWIGDQHSVSSTHKDPYENLYAVVFGVKVFTLLPPGDAPWLGTTAAPHGQYVPAQEGSEQRTWTAQLTAAEGGCLQSCGCRVATVPWVGVDPCDPCASTAHPPFKHAHPVTVKVHPGETLYLPALWYHRVTQEGVCIAVNYWHDMSYGPGYGLSQLVQALAPALPAAAANMEGADEHAQDG